MGMVRVVIIDIDKTTLEHFRIENGVMEQMSGIVRMTGSCKYFQFHAENPTFRELSLGIPVQIEKWKVLQYALNIQSDISTLLRPTVRIRDSGQVEQIF